MLRYYALFLFLVLRVSWSIFVNYHITHHAGTTMFFLAKRANLAFDGMNSIYNIVTRNPQKQYDLWISNITTNSRSWKWRSSNDVVLDRPREYVSVEEPLKSETWQGFPVDFPDVYTLFIMRHPIDRLLSGDGNMPHDAKTGNYGKWFQHQSTKQYGLRWLSGADPKEHLTEKHLAIALERVKHFDHIAIQEALPETLRFLCEEWKWSVCIPTGHARSEGKTLVSRIGEDELLKAKLEEHYLDFKLYDECLKMSREQNRNRNTPALDAIPDNMYEYEMNLLREHMSHSNAEQQHRRASSSNASTSGEAYTGYVNFTFTALHYPAERAVAVAESFDWRRSEEFERNRAIAHLY